MYEKKVTTSNHNEKNFFLLFYLFLFLSIKYFSFASLLFKKKSPFGEVYFEEKMAQS